MQTSPERSLATLHRGFRSSYLSYAELTAQLEAWARAFPELCRLSSLGSTPEGRCQWLLCIGREPERVRPAAWVDGNMHALELAGSSVALAIAEDVLRLHLEPERVPEGLSPGLCERLREVLFYVVPRLSPDGAEHVLDTGRYVRSVPRDERVERQRARWVSGDVDGDGLSLLMRVEDAGGEFVESTEHPGLMFERTIDDVGPFYKLYPEGLIENFDGKNVPPPRFLDDNPIDLNRNFPWSWAPSHEQVGAGPFAASEPESRNVVAFATRHPEIFFWLNLHTFGGVAIRPLGHAPDSKLHGSDLALFRQIEAWLKELTGYPTVSGFEEFLYEPDKPLHGDLSDYAYHQRGAISYVIELWDLFTRLGLPRSRRFVDHYQQLGRAELLRLARWDSEQNEGRIFRPWRRLRHPQLGDVEAGGMDPRIGVWNPSLAELGKLCAEHSPAFLRVAGLAPALRFERTSVSALGGDVYGVELSIANHGYLPTWILESAKALELNEPLSIFCEPDGPVLLDPARAQVHVGHLEGWGRGLHSGVGGVHYPRSSGTGHRAHASYLVKGSGTLRFRVGSCRVGWLEQSVQVGGTEHG
jgi:zinc carboxypeptidase